MKLEHPVTITYIYTDMYTNTPWLSQNRERAALFLSHSPIPVCGAPYRCPGFLFHTDGQYVQMSHGASFSCPSTLFHSARAAEPGWILFKAWHKYFEKPWTAHWKWNYPYTFTVGQVCIINRPLTAQKLFQQQLTHSEPYPSHPAFPCLWWSVWGLSSSAPPLSPSFAASCSIRDICKPKRLWKE